MPRHRQPLSIWAPGMRPKELGLARNEGGARHVLGARKPCSMKIGWARRLSSEAASLV
jgi:hypothetical protein